MESASSEASAWTWWQRALFRLAFLYWGKFCLSNGILGQLTWVAPWLDRWVLRWPFAVLDWPTDALAKWFATRVFHLTGIAAARHQTGSGDTALDWIAALSLLVFAVVGALVWTAVAEWRGKRTEYRTLYAWLRLGMRFFLASVLLGYGFSKVFDLQFSVPGMYTLNERYGDSTPMGLLWTFMGYSVPYTVFAGIAEVVPGMLLLFRRTMTAGALGAAAVLLNVVLLNFCYDVPVKLYSSTYLAMALFLLLPDAGPMARFFFGHAEARLRGVWLPRPERPALRIAGYCLQALVVGHLLFDSAWGGYGQWRKKPAATVSAAVSAAMNPEYANVDGAWIVDSSSGWPDRQRWIAVTIGRLRYRSIDFLQVTQADGVQQNFGDSMDWNHRIHFLTPADSVLQWTLDARGNATLEGIWMGQPARLTMHSVEPRNTYSLLSTGFHWVQEMPNGR